MTEFVILTATNGDKVALRPKLVKGFEEYKLGAKGETQIYYKRPNSDQLVIKETFSAVLKMLDDA